ncbi:MAG: phosphomannomutase/phosphoglucomutase [Bacteroidales bacterium]|nr:phosphomannomutase/phosphoglucomutase [Bacteroidales bacterium]MBN2821188.1 phosphomannomutase/phosphoglucomutase [Bacteroidales bacterium]
MDLKALQNGSDIRGIAIDTIPGEPVNLTQEAVFSIGAAFSIWIQQKFNEEILVGIGMDSRLSGSELKNYLSEGLTQTGCNVIDFGLATTPAMFMSTQFDETNCTAGIMITASHLPFNRNGFKFFLASGGLNKSDISEILLIAEKKNWKYKSPTSVIKKGNIIDIYSNHLLKIIRTKTGTEKPFIGNRIIVDAGNGAGGFFANKVLEPLGADTAGSLFLDPDGNFPNHAPNPEDKKAIESIVKAVKKNNCDMGIIFDTDVDRAAVVDSYGTPINRNALIALLSAIVLEEHPATTIVTDSVTSDGLSEYITRLGGRHHRYKRGYRNVINEAIKLNDKGEETWLAIETSGHGALKENYFLDDGAYLVVKILTKLYDIKKQNRTLADILKDLKAPAESEEFRIKIKTKDFTGYGKKIISSLTDYCDQIEGWEIVPNNYEGIRVKCKQTDYEGWFLLRLSLHDPVLPLNIETNRQGGIRKILKNLIPYLQKFVDLEISSLT